MSSALGSRTRGLVRPALAALDLQSRTVRAPFHGYVPGQDAAFVPASAFEDVMGLIEQGGELGPDYGWLRFEDEAPVAAPLPLGNHDAGNLPVFNGTPPGAHIIRADLFVRRAGGLTFENMALTNSNLDDGTGAPGPVQHLRLYRYGGAGQWESIPSLGAPLMTGVQLVADSTTYSPADLWIFCTTDDDVRVYDPTGPNHHVLACSIANFKARSVCVHDERVLFLNTTEGGNAQELRVRWTKPGWTTESAANFTDPGSGALDLIEFAAAGVAIRQLDTRIACYTGDGVVMLDRTFSTTAPFRKQIITRTRGLLGTHAVTDMGGGVHFGVFNDGFFLFDASGRFTEAGTFTVQNDIHRKATQKFFDLLKWTARHRVLVHREAGPRGLVYIAFPTGTTAVGSDADAPDMVWIYDPRTDSIWPDTTNYIDRAFSVTAAMPSTFANFVEVTYGGPTWDAMPNTWATTVGSWGSYSQTTGHYRMVHGTWDGYIYQHEPAMVGRQIRSQTITPVYHLQAYPTHYGAPHQAKTLRRVGVEYRNSGTPQLVGVLAMDGQNTASVLQFGTFTANQGSPGGSLVDYVTLHVRREHLATRIAGTHPTILKSWEELYSIERSQFEKLS